MGCFGNNNGCDWIWWIIILLIIFCVCDNGCNNRMGCDNCGCNNNCGC